MVVVNENLEIYNNINNKNPEETHNGGRLINKQINRQTVEQMKNESLQPKHWWSTLEKKINRSPPKIFQWRFIDTFSLPLTTNLTQACHV